MNKEFQFLIYNVPTEDVTVNAIIKDETIWLTQKTLVSCELKVSPEALNIIVK